MSPAGCLVAYLFRWVPHASPTGLFPIGTPDERSPVIVTANFSLTVKRVRRALRGQDLWLLVANSGGINVWCAAAGGTFNEHRVIDEQEVLFKDSGWIPSRRDLDYGDIMGDEPRFKVFVDIPKDAEVYFEVMASSYTELWTKVGEIIQTAYRDAGLLNNMSGCREVVKKAHETANQILKSNNEYGE